MPRIFEVLLLCCLAPLAGAQTTPAAGTAPATAPAHTLTLDDLFSARNIVDTAVSPSGQYIAVILRRDGIEDLIVVVDVKAGTRKAIRSLGVADFDKSLEARMLAVYWKSDQRLLFRVRTSPVPGRTVSSLTQNALYKIGERLYASDRDGSHTVGLLFDNRNEALTYAFDLGNIASFLEHDPAHILLFVEGAHGPALFKADLETGHGEQVEPAIEHVLGWWLDVDGNPVVRLSSIAGTVSLFRKQDGKWVRFLKMRLREMRDRPEYESVGPSDQAGKYYVLARPPGHDRVGLYLYDLEKETFGEPVVEDARYDLTSAEVSRDGKRVIYHCYLAHVRVCEFSDAKLNAHMKGLRKFFADSANVIVHDTSKDGSSILLFVEGPRDPPSFYYYVTSTKHIENVGATGRDLSTAALPNISVVAYQARDGKALEGYLTSPANAPPGTKLPLVMYPHGGPEMRDHLTFDPWVQYLAARGYAVFQPNFRGSDGFGKEFAASGYGEWGRKMQDDITDGLAALVKSGAVDPARVCIVGASYGGYAALAGAALTPDLYRCAVSVAGIADLEDFIGWRKRNWGRTSEGYTYWLKAIGDPEEDEQKLAEVSPARLVQKIKAPVLLIHGTKDEIVPIAQSRAMKRALDKTGRKTELIEMEGEGHSFWSNENEMYALSSIDAFLWKHLGPGAGATSPPVMLAAPKR